MINKVKLVQLHEPLFLAGVNFGNKLQPRSGKGLLELSHDTESDHVLVDFNGERAHIKNWASFNEDRVTLSPVKPVERIRAIPAINAQASGPGQGLKFNAQVETPIDKVQGKPGRKAKYQGEESQGE
jgi:hypothetical protein